MTSLYVVSGFADGILFECKLNGGDSDNQIYINEEEGYVVYNAQNRKDGNYERKREYTVNGGNEGPTRLLDDGLDIQANNELFIWASDKSCWYER